ncbi:uncharacterized protein LOC143051198 [Mytilus galloprovincialis]|uniref:uncharacterized protein LOC143051198 n=1 Tax=Mytilus galloprovincialis TaxID=29158 RepID=UPI003F7BEDA2
MKMRKFRHCCLERRYGYRFVFSFMSIVFTAKACLAVTVCWCVYACIQIVNGQVPVNGPFDLNNEPFDIDDGNIDRTLLLLNEGSQEATPGNGVCLAVGVLLGLSVPIRSSEGSMMSIGQMTGMNVMNAMRSMMTGTAVTPVMPTVCPSPVICPSPVSVPTCEFGWTLRGTSCYFFSGTQLGWNAAQSSCQAMGGRLAELETIEEINAVKGVASVRNKQRFWIGGQRFGQGRFDFKWASTDQPITVPDWALPVQPNNQGGNQDCILLSRPNQYRWNDRPCRVTSHYICEKSATTAVCRN